MPEELHLKEENSTQMQTSPADNDNWLDEHKDLLVNSDPLPSLEDFNNGNRMERRAGSDGDSLPDSPASLVEGEDQVHFSNALNYAKVLKWLT